jgi:hypothetical protein
MRKREVRGEAMGIAAKNLQMLSEGLSIEPAVVRAVVEIEASGRGFLPEPTVTPGGVDVSGRPVIQFEGHCFWQYLVNLKEPSLSPTKLLNENENYVDILYPKWTKKYMLSGDKEWDQLLRARGVHEGGADESASWGMFQIMGFNYGACGCGSINQYVRMMESERGQCEAFMNFIQNNGPIWKALKNKDWAGFAYRYNGPGYAKNQYDVKLQKRYERYKK